MYRAYYAIEGYIVTNFIPDEILFEFLQALVLLLERVGPALHHRCAF